jgi:hypothetical protein
MRSEYFCPIRDIYDTALVLCQEEIESPGFGSALEELYLVGRFLVGEPPVRLLLRAAFIEADHRRAEEAYSSDEEYAPRSPDRFGLLTIRRPAAGG